MKRTKRGPAKKVAKAAKRKAVRGATRTRASRKAMPEY